MNTPTVLITGGNSGIGMETAVALAAHGMRVIITSRDPARGEAARAEIERRTREPPTVGYQVGSVEVRSLDLADLNSVQRLADDLHRDLDHLDVLINNAGGVQRRRTETVQGFETQWGVNHLGPFLLTRLLLDLLLAAPAPRVVNVASAAHRAARTGISWPNLDRRHRRYRGFRVYAETKLANVLFTRELAQREPGLIVHAAHPGAVATNFGKDGDLSRGFAALEHLGGLLGILASPAKGAETSVHLASDPEAGSSTGGYWSRCRPARVSRVAANPAAAHRLWRESEAQLHAVGFLTVPAPE